MNLLPAALLEVGRWTAALLEVLSPFGHDYFLAQGHDLKVWKVESLKKSSSWKLDRGLRHSWKLDDGPLRCWKLDDGPLRCWKFLAQGHDLKVWDDGVKSQESKVRTKS